MKHRIARCSFQMSRLCKHFITFYLRDKQYLICELRNKIHASNRKQRQVSEKIQRERSRRILANLRHTKRPTDSSCGNTRVFRNRDAYFRCIPARKKNRKNKGRECEEREKKRKRSPRARAHPRPNLTENYNYEPRGGGIRAV